MFGLYSLDLRMIINQLKLNKMTTYTDLNNNEISVLKAISISSKCNGGDFTYFEYVMKNINLSEAQVKGYLSQLEKKDYISIQDKQIVASGEVDFLTDYEF